jgi:hypothetical protein
MIIIAGSWDNEYPVQWIEEMKFLKEHGIRYTWVKTDDNGLTVWKYKKNLELFKCLCLFYENIYTK